MNSKDALRKLFYVVYNCRYLDKEERKQLEKGYMIIVNDLLILDRLKANTSINEQYKKLKENLEK